MQIGCPECAVRYEVPEGAVRSGRAVRCARCAAVWVPEAGTPPPPPPPSVASSQATSGEAASPAGAVEALPPDGDGRSSTAPLPAPAAGRSFGDHGAPPAWPPLPPSLPTPPARRGPPVLLGWAATGVVLAAAVACAILFRTGIEAVWPPAGRLYALVGLVTRR